MRNNGINCNSIKLYYRVVHRQHHQDFIKNNILCCQLEIANNAQNKGEIGKNLLFGKSSTYKSNRRCIYKQILKLR